MPADHPGGGRAVRQWAGTLPPVLIAHPDHRAAAVRLTAAAAVVADDPARVVAALESTAAVVLDLAGVHPDAGAELLAMLWAR